MTSLRGSWQLLCSRDSVKLAEVKPSLSSFTPSEYNLYCICHHAIMPLLKSQLGLCILVVATTVELCSVFRVLQWGAGLYATSWWR
jgi:hypothetical protein